MLRNPGAASRPLPNVPMRQQPAALCLPHSAIPGGGGAGGGKDGIQSARAIPAKEHAQAVLSPLPRAKRPASEKDADASQLCQDTFHEVREVLKAQKDSRDKSCALIPLRRTPRVYVSIRPELGRGRRGDDDVLVLSSTSAPSV